MDNNLMQKLMMSKAIMDKVNQIDKTGVKNSNQKPALNVEEFNAPNAKYNIPQEFLSENPKIKNNLSDRSTSVESIKNSKLPDEIKRLMIEHPIQKQQAQETVLSDELVEKASRLMKNNFSNNYNPEEKVKKDLDVKQVNSTSLRKMIKEVVEECLKSNGLLIESEEKTNENFTFKVGKHIFEGKVTKVKKIE